MPKAGSPRARRTPSSSSARTCRRSATRNRSDGCGTHAHTVRGSQATAKGRPWLRTRLAALIAARCARINCVADGASVEITCNWLFSAAGYYDYSGGHTPELPGRFPGVGHMPQIERPAAFVEVVRRFLADEVPNFTTPTDTAHRSTSE